jgi:hypothetical protein
MSTVILDTITGKSTATTITIGSTPVVSASANSMTIRGEGSAQTSIQGGLTKAGVNLNGTGTIAIRDSFNVTSCTDDGTGLYTVTIANDMADTNYATTSGMARSGLSSCSFLADGSWAATTGSHACYCSNNANSAVDVHAMLASFLGDLA